MSEFEAPGTHANIRARDASTLILLDRSGSNRKSCSAVAMPAMSSCPTGWCSPAAVSIPTIIASSWQHPCRTPSSSGLSPAQAPLGAHVHSQSPPSVNSTKRPVFASASFDSALPAHYDPAIPSQSSGCGPICRSCISSPAALTPPGRVRRYDTYFFAADASLIAHRIAGAVGADTELVELVWLTLEAAKAEDLPTITRMVLDDLEAQMASGASLDAPAPFYRFSRGTRRRDLF